MAITNKKFVKSQFNVYLDIENFFFGKWWVGSILSKIFLDYWIFLYLQSPLQTSGYVVFNNRVVKNLHLQKKFTWCGCITTKLGCRGVSECGSDNTSE